MSENLPNAAEMGAMGGKARAESLTPKQRSEQARRAVEARWRRSTPKATHEGTLHLGSPTGISLEIPCSVLMDGTRLISERGFTKSLGGKRGGSHWHRRREAGEEGGAELPLFLSANNLRPYISTDLALALKPLKYQPISGGVAHGIKAEIIPEICNVYLRAREDDELHASQEHIAQKAEIIMRGLARVGIIALIDEATGYQYDRPARALAEILEAFVAEELRPYIKTFPISYFRELCRVRGVHFSEDMRLPSYFGHLTNDLVYSRLAPGVLTKLREVNPVEENGRRKGKHFQHLTEDVGHPKLLQHLGSVITLMKLSNDWDDLKRKVDQIHPPYTDCPLFADLEDY